MATVGDMNWAIHEIGEPCQETVTFPAWSSRRISRNAPGRRKLPIGGDAAGVLHDRLLDALKARAGDAAKIGAAPVGRKPLEAR
jgi:hypothetical protein